MIDDELYIFLESLKNLAAAYLFGSIANGSENSKSDIDIALVIKDYRRGDIDRLKLMVDISRIAKRDADVLILNDSSPRLVHEVLKKGRPAVINDPEYTAKFLNYQRKLYNDYRYMHNIYMKGLTARYDKQKHN